MFLRFLMDIGARETAAAAAEERERKAASGTLHLGIIPVAVRQRRLCGRSVQVSAGGVTGAVRRATTRRAGPDLAIAATAARVGGCSVRLEQAPDGRPAVANLDALAPLPILAIRGELSDILSAETLHDMGRRHSGMRSAIVAGVGRAPMLDAPSTRCSVARPRHDNCIRWGKCAARWPLARLSDARYPCWTGAVCAKPQETR